MSSFHTLTVSEMCEESPQGSKRHTYKSVFCVKIERLVFIHLLTCNSLLHKQ